MHGGAPTGHEQQLGTLQASTKWENKGAAAAGESGQLWGASRQGSPDLLPKVQLRRLPLSLSSQGRDNDMT